MQYKNRPPHIYLDDTYYFLTSRTLGRKPFFNTDSKKKILLDVIREAIRRYGCNLIAWVVLSNHYHLLLKIKEGKQLPDLLRNIHANSSRLLNKSENLQGRAIWWNYWDHGIRDEADFWKHFNYINHNPVKHGYVKEMSDYKFSSYNYWLKKKGQDWIDSCFELYPIVDFTPQDV